MATAEAVAKKTLRALSDIRSELRELNAKIDRLVGVELVVGEVDETEDDLLTEINAEPETGDEGAVEPSESSEEPADLDALNLDELKALADQHGIPYGAKSTKKELVALLKTLAPLG